MFVCVCLGEKEHDAAYAQTLECTCVCVWERVIRCGWWTQGQIALIFPFAVSATFPKWLLFASVAARTHLHAPGELGIS